MTDAEPTAPEIEAEGRWTPPTTIRIATWRYLGDRAAADGAYCARFGVSEAPEPNVAPGGAWAYALPALLATR